jgi:hypothetical protein
VQATLVKRLFVLLAVIALVGGPWAQALAQGALHRCASAPAIAAAADVVVDQTSPCDDMAAHKADAGKTMSPSCAQDCLAQVNLVAPASDLIFERPLLAFESGLALVIDGRTPEPELSPPIALS